MGIRERVVLHAKYKVCILGILILLFMLGTGTLAWADFFIQQSGTQTISQDLAGFANGSLSFEYRRYRMENPDIFRYRVCDPTCGGWVQLTGNNVWISVGPVSTSGNTVVTVEFNLNANSSTEFGQIRNESIVGSGSISTPTPTPTGAPTVTPTPGGSPTATPTPSGPTPTPTATPIYTPTPTARPNFTKGLESHAYPTYLFVASYDWLHNFHDANTYGSTGANQQAPDTDNFNKIIVLDANLFPILTAVAGDHEFPNVTSRNAATWSASAASPGSPSINDYFNRSIAVAPDFIPLRNFRYQINPEMDSEDYDFPGIEMYGGRSMVEWAFIADPGNHNIRRYEFRKLGDFYAVFDFEDFDDLPSPAGTDATTVCNNAPPGIENSWVKGNTPDILDGVPFRSSYISDIPPETGTCDPTALTDPEGCIEQEEILFLCKHNIPSGISPKLDDLTGTKGIVDYINAGQVHGPYPYLEIMLDIPKDDFNPPFDLDIDIHGGSRESSSDILAVGRNTECGDRRPTSVAGTLVAGCNQYAPTADYHIVYGGPALPKWGSLNDVKRHNVYSFPITNNDYDLDNDPDNGFQMRIRIYALGQGGFVIEKIEIGERDAAFAVKYEGDEALIATRWANLTSFLETVPPKSFPGYPIYTSPTEGTVGYGYTTNTSFTTAQNVRFKNPRDIDVYRDIFDVNNKAPTYIFVADTMNSRIQVFMNATGSAGESNAEFPIRPVRVKGPNDNTDANSDTAFLSNELGMRIYSSDGSSISSIGFGDGRKADWRHYTTMPGTAFENITTGKGEFFYPHGLAVDHDPDTKDVYLFVADTFNHRIQVFRDATGVTFHPITNKQFDFQYKGGWGTYPLQTTETMTAPGAYNFRYPKGLDVVRFKNNSSYLYVVDSKNYRLLKYKIGENPAGGISSITIDAGYGSDGSDFVTTLTTNQGVPLEAHGSFAEAAEGGLASLALSTVGFLNPQDVATGYSGFYLYSTPHNEPYTHELDRGAEPPLGIKYLNNYMVYVTDYARNNTTIGPDRVNMRIMQFIENLGSMNGVYLPWKTEVVQFDKGELGQSAFGPGYGVYSSDGASGSTGSTENVPGQPNYFTDRPVGIAALTWDTVTPFDLRVVDLTNSIVFPNGTSIARTRQLQVGVQSLRFFGLPETTLSTYTDYTPEELELDGKRIKRVHVFCYDTNSIFRGHTALPEPPYTFRPTDISAGCTGYMKVIPEHKYFGYSGKTGTMIFRLQ